MMIDAKKYEELCGKRAGLRADAMVYKAMSEFVMANMERCKAERNYLELQAWMDALKDITCKSKKIIEDYTKVVEEIEYT